MPITQAMCTSFKVESLRGIHAFGTTVVRAGTTADTFKIALYTSAANLDATTTAYPGAGVNGEVSNSGTNYTHGGNTLTVSTSPTSTGTTAFLSFNNTTWSNATLTARGALIYNTTQTNRSVLVLDFGSDKTSTDGDFTILFPTADASNAILRIV